MSFSGRSKELIWSILGFSKWSKRLIWGKTGLSKPESGTFELLKSWKWDILGFSKCSKSENCQFLELGGTVGAVGIVVI